MKTELLLLGLATTAVIAIPVTAQDTAVVRGRLLTDLIVRTVSYADLNLASASGQDRLHDRVDLAVSAVCREALGPSPVYYAKISCAKRAWRGAKPQIERAIGDFRSQSANHGASRTAAIKVALRE